VGSYAVNALIKVGDFNNALPTKHFVEDEFTNGLKHKVLNEKGETKKEESLAEWNVPSFSPPSFFSK
jgi:hypothetical protein